MDSTIATNLKNIMARIINDEHTYKLGTVS